MKGKTVNNIFIPATILSGLFMLLPAASTASVLSPGDFHYCAEIPGPFINGTLYRVPLPSRVLEECHEKCIDARILGNDHAEIPRVVLEDVLPAETPDTYQLEVLSFEQDAVSSTLTLGLPGKYRPISALEIRTSDRDFNKHVLVFGSRDRLSWGALTEGDIFDFSSQVDLRKTRIEFNETDYRYFRLKLVDNISSRKEREEMRLRYKGLDFTAVGTAKKDIRIQTVEGRTRAGDARQPLYDEARLENVDKQTDKEGNTVLQFSTRLPVDRFALDIANPYFYRTVRVYGSSTGKGDYQLLTSEVIYRFPLSARNQEAKTLIACRRPQRGFYKIVVTNKNNPALEIKALSAGWGKKNLFFIALSDAARYSLCYGNEALKRPDYDLERFITEATVRSQRSESKILGMISENRGYEPDLPDERKARNEKTTLTIIVVVMAVGMGFWLFRLMKKAGGRTGK